MFRRIFNFYVDGFRNLSWGKPLWVLIILKLIFIFLVLRLFFFRPTLSGLSDQQKSNRVASNLTNTK